MDQPRTIVTQMVAMYRSGWHLRDLSVAYGVSHETVRKVLKETGQYRPHLHGRDRRDLDHDAIVNFYRRGVGLEKIAERFGVAPATVKRQLVERGVKIRPPGSGGRGRTIELEE